MRTKGLMMSVALVGILVAFSGGVTFSRQTGNPQTAAQRTQGQQINALQTAAQQTELQPTGGQPAYGQPTGVQQVEGQQADKPLEFDWSQPDGESSRATQALNMLESRGDARFSDFAISGDSFTAEVTKDGRTMPVMINPDKRQITPLSGPSQYRASGTGATSPSA